MATSAAEASPRLHGDPIQMVRTDAGVGWLVGVLLFSSLAIVTGLIWDISWHLTIGRDTLWSPPHVLEQIGAGAAGLACGFLVLRTTLVGSVEARAGSVRFWGFRAPLGAWVAIWGAFAMIFSVPFDDWWHNAYGLDVEILSPPHIVLLAGMLAIQLGAMLLALGMQNRASTASVKRIGLAYVVAAGALTAMVAIAISEYTIQPNLWHSGLTWKVAGAVFPFFLLATARAGRVRLPATGTALTYMVIFLVTQWILVQFEATPRFAPIVRPLTHMAAYGFPMLLVAPALAIDLGLRHWNRIGDWKLAGLLGTAFIVIAVAVHWPFATFLVESPLAQNDFFLARHWPYFSTPGDFERTFWDARPLLSAAFMTDMAIAAAIATLSSRAGLAWGSWMRKVQR
jgi:hypothetical protein